MSVIDHFIGEYDLNDCKPVKLCINFRNFELNFSIFLFQNISPFSKLSQSHFSWSWVDRSFQSSFRSTIYYSTFNKTPKKKTKQVQRILKHFFLPVLGNNFFFKVLKWFWTSEGCKVLRTFTIIIILYSNHGELPAEKVVARLKYYESSILKSSLKFIM